MNTVVEQQDRALIPREWQPFIGLTILAAAAAFTIAFFVQILDDDFSAPLILIGGALVEATLQIGTVWAALGAGGFAARTRTALLMIVAVMTAGICGLVIGDTVSVRGEDWLPLIAHGLMLFPAFWLVCQCPFWLLRFRGWHVDLWSPETKPAKITISDLMGLTLMVAIAIAGLQTSLASLPESSPSFLAPNRSWVWAIGAFFTIKSLVIGMVYMVPALLLMMTPKQRDYENVALGAIGFVCVLTGLACMFDGMEGMLPSVMCHLSAFMFCIALACFQNRVVGWTLWTPGRRKRWEAEGLADCHRFPD